MGSQTKLAILLLFLLGISTAAKVSLLPPEIDNNGKSFHVTCDCASFRDEVFKNNPGVNIKWHARFLADKTEVKAIDLTPADVNICKLPLAFDEGIDKNMNKDYTCELTATVSGSKKVFTSTSFNRFLGVRPESNILTVPEGQQKMVKIVSTVPILCEHNYQCCLPLDLQIGTQQNQLATLTQCVYDLCKQDWNETSHSASVEIPVVANPDRVKDGNSRLLIKFRPLIPAGGGDVHQIFENVKIRPVQVVVEDVPDGVCGVGGDPHVLRFDHQMVHLLEVGDYLLYQNDDKDFEVHIRTWPCALDGPFPQVSCTSGIIVRDRNDVVRLSLADDIPLPPFYRHLNRQQKLAYQLSHTRFTVKSIEGGLQDGTTVMEDRTTVMIDFPSGVQMTARAATEYIDAVMAVPSTFSFDARTRGLCGPQGNSSAGMLVDAHGQAHQCVIWDVMGKGCRSAPYTQSWKLSSKQTLFHNRPPSKPHRPQNNDVFCGCAQNQVNLANPVINCTNDGNKQPVRKGCPNCKDVTNSIGRGIYGGTFGPSAGKRDSSTFSWDPYEFLNGQTNYTGPQQSPKPSASELANARSECEGALNTSYIIHLCDKMTSLKQTFTSQCIVDFVLSGDDRFVKSAVNSFDVQCLYYLQQDPANYVTQPDGSLKIKDEIEKICSQDCMDHGICDNGTCVCDSGWSGFHCTHNDTAASLPSVTTFTAGTNGQTQPGTQTSIAAPLSSTPPTNTQKTNPSANAQTSSSLAIKGSGQTTAQPTQSPVTSSSSNTMDKIVLKSIIGYSQNGSKHDGDQCDVTKGKCDSVVLKAEPFDASVTSITCVRDLLKNSDSSLISHTSLPGNIVNRHEIECPLPDVFVGIDQGPPHQSIRVIISTQNGHTSNSMKFTLFDSNCVDATSHYLVLSDQVCVIEDYCHSDGAINALVDGERCVISKSTTRWTKVLDTALSPDVKKLVLTEPNDQFQSTCHFDKIAHPPTVDWYVNGRKAKTQHVTSGQTSVTVSLFDIWGIGPPLIVDCRILIDAGRSTETEYVSNSITIV